MSEIGKKVSLISSISLVFISIWTSVFAARSDAGEVAACFGLSSTCLIFVIAIPVINIMLMVWVVKDAKARGAGSPIGWLILVLLTGPIGLIIYYFSRPKGELVECPNCKNKRLAAMSKCPHCGN